MSPRSDAATLSAAFRHAILDPDRPTPAGVAAWGGGRADKRFAVYRNNVTVSLVSALGDIFPAVRRIVGPALFAEIAKAHVRASPPSSPLLAEYGRGFAAYLADCRPVGALPYLADVARLERLWLDAFHAADRPVLQPAALAAVPPDVLADIRFEAHPATSLMASAYAVHAIFAANRFSDVVGAIETRRPERVLVTRPGLDVMVTPLAAGKHAFLLALLAGAPLGEAAAVGLGEDSDFDLGGAIAQAMATCAFSGIALPAETGAPAR